MVISPWVPLLLAIPVLLLGEYLVKRISLLSRFNIPAPVVGGLLVSAVVVGLNALDLHTVRIETSTAARWWTWLVSTGPEWSGAPAKSINLPFLVAFFTCIGLNASWDLAKRGSFQVITFLLVASVLAVVQNVLGLALARLMGVPPLLGLVCGSLTLTGGPSTALGFAPVLEKAGLPTAAVAGMAAATFGLVAGGLVGGPIGGALIRRRGLQPAMAPGTHLEMGQTAQGGILSDFRVSWSFGPEALWHLALLLVCVKLGAWVSYLLQSLGLTFPVAMGAMLVGVTLRNLTDLLGWKCIRTDVVDTLASITLGIFLTIAMVTLNLIDLANAALPMLAILSVQVIVMGLFAWFVTFRTMGADFDAAVLAAGHCGFGLGATPNAIANMKSLVETFGPAPRAFLVVPIVGGFLIDFVNALNITVFINLVK